MILRKTILFLYTYVIVVAAKKEQRLNRLHCETYYEWSFPPTTTNDAYLLAEEEYDYSGSTFITSTENYPGGVGNIGIFNTPLYTSIDDIIIAAGAGAGADADADATSSSSNATTPNPNPPPIGRVVGAYWSTATTPPPTTTTANTTTNENNVDDDIILYTGYWNFHLFDKDSWISASLGFDNSNYTDSTTLRNVPSVIIGGSGDYSGYVGTVSHQIIHTENNNANNNSDNSDNATTTIIEWTICPHAFLIEEDEIDECKVIWEHDESATTLIDNETFIGDYYNGGSAGYMGVLDNPLFSSLNDSVNKTNLDGRNLGGYFVNKLNTTTALLNIQLNDNDDNDNDNDWIVVSFGWSFTELDTYQNNQPNIILGGSGMYAGIKGTIDDAVYEFLPIPAVPAEINNNETTNNTNTASETTNYINQINNYKLCSSSSSSSQQQTMQQQVNDTFDDEDNSNNNKCTKLFVLPIEEFHSSDGGLYNFSGSSYYGNNNDSDDSINAPYYSYSIGIHDYPFYMSKYNIIGGAQQPAGRFMGTSFSNTPPSSPTSSGNGNGSSSSRTTTELSNFHFFNDDSWLSGNLGSTSSSRNGSSSSSSSGSSTFIPPDVITGGTKNWTGFIGRAKRSERSIINNDENKNVPTDRGSSSSSVIMIEYTICPEGIEFPSEEEEEEEKDNNDELTKSSSDGSSNNDDETTSSSSSSSSSQSFGGSSRDIICFFIQYLLAAVMMTFSISDNKEEEEEEEEEDNDINHNHDRYRYGYRYRHNSVTTTTSKMGSLFLFPILLSSMVLYTLPCNVMASSSDTNSHDRSNDDTIPSSKSKSKRTPPNIVILLADNLAYDDVGVFRQQQQQDGDGGCSDDEEENNSSISTTSRTHNLDKAALDGRRLLNWNSPAVLCSASRAALLTGKYPIRTGIYPRVFEPDAAYGLLPNETTLADYLHDEGYATKIVGKWHLGQRDAYLPTKRGFDEWFGIPYHMSAGSIDDHVCGKDTTGKMWLPLFDGTSIVEQPVQLENLAPRYVEESIKFMKTNVEEKERPFFLYLAFSHVHQLCAPRHSECQWASTHFSRNKTKGYNATFDDAVEEMDWIAGKVFDSIRELGAEDNTLVLFTSDNGPWVAEGSCSGSKGPFLGQWLADNVEQNCTACPSEYFSKPLPDRPRRCVYQGNNTNYEVDGVHCGQDTGLGSAWESNVRMPAFVKWPGGGIQSGSKTMDMVTTLDVVPTILSIIGSKNIPSDLDGIDESDVFFGIEKENKDDRVIFFWRDGFRNGPLPQPFGRFDVVAMKIGPIKFWFWTKSSHYNADEEVYHDPPLLFNVLDDPAEAYPLDDSEVYAPLIARARILIQEHKDSIDWTYPLCLDRDTKFLPCVDETSNCRTAAGTTVAATI